MKKRIFITASFKGLENKKEIEWLCDLVDQCGFNSFNFIRDVEKYYSIFPAKTMMEKATKKIKKSDLFILQYNGNGTGSLIEAGVAYSGKIPIITICPIHIKIKKSVAGISSHIILFKNMSDLKTKLSKLLKKWNIIRE